MIGEVAVLVVDDRAEDRLAIEATLKGRGFDLVMASDGHTALRRVLERDFAVILLDVVMPGLDGLEVARIIKQRERSQHTPILFLTGADPDLRGLYQGYSVGAVDYLVKPIDPDVLRAKTQIFVDLFQKDQRIRQQAAALREADRRERDRELASMLLAEQRRYENLAEAMPDIVWITDPAGALIYTNRRWTEATGWTLETTQRRGLTGALEAPDGEIWETRWRMARGAGSPFDATVRLIQADGTRRWHIGRAVPERDAEGNIVAWLGTLTDHDDLRRALDAAESAVRARDAFLSLASHELRTPLTTLQLRLRSLGRRLAATEPPDADALRMTSSAIKQGERLARLVDDLLDVARIATGQLTLELQRFDLGDAVADVLERFEEAASDAGCEIRWGSRVPIEGEWDRLRVEQAVQNLIANALRYAPGAPVEISVELENEDGVIRVRDRGPGIPESELERAFHRFARIPTARQHTEGLGLGLHLVREIANAHGGTARAERPEGGGTRVTIRLPLERPAPKSQSEPSPPPTTRRIGKVGLRASRSASRR